MLPIIKKRDDIARHDQQRVVVSGRYALVNVNKRPGGKPVYQGYVSIELEDTYVLLETHEKAIRTPQEIEKFRDKNVLVTGKICSHCTLWGDGSTASIVGACVREVEEIREE